MRMCRSFTRISVHLDARCYSGTLGYINSNLLFSQQLEYIVVLTLASSCNSILDNYTFQIKHLNLIRSLYLFVVRFTLRHLTESCVLSTGSSIHPIFPQILCLNHVCYVICLNCCVSKNCYHCFPRWTRFVPLQPLVYHLT